MKKVCGASDAGRFFVTGPTDVATKPSHFYCRIYRKDVSVLTHGHHEFLRHFQGSKHFSCDQRLRLETPGWEVLDYKANAMSPVEEERHREKIMRAPLVVRDREYAFSEDVIVYKTSAVDPNFGVMAKVSPLIELLRLGGYYELVWQLWAQFTLSAVRVNTWMLRGHATRSWLVFGFAPYILRGPCVPICWLFQSIILNVMYPRILSRCINWARSHGSCSVKFEEEGDKVRVFFRTWDIDIFERVCVATLDRYSSDPHQEITALGRTVDVLGPDMSTESISGGSTVLVETFCKYPGSGYRQKPIDYPFLDLRLFKPSYSGQLPVCSVDWTGSP